jgi:superfamily II DNA or RNA helicase
MDLLFPSPEKFKDSQWYDRHSAYCAGLNSSQIFTVMYMHPLTPYRSLLVSHSVGTGKTRSCVVLARLWVSYGLNVVFIAYSKSTLKNFENEYRLHGEQNNLDQNLPSNILKFGSISMSNRVNLDPNALYIIDEVHNIRSNNSTYNSLKAKFRGMPNARFLLLTGTPMVDSAQDLFDLKNLADCDTPVSKIVVPNEINPIESNIEVVWPRNVTAIVKYKPISMKGVQLEKYFESGSKQMYIRRRQISIACDVKNTPSPFLKNLRFRSCKLWDIASRLDPQSKELSVIYVEFITEWGVEAIAHMLQNIGYVKWGEPGNCYAECTGRSDFNSVINTFNNINNTFGNDIKVLIISKVANESITLKSVSNLYILSPHWNFSRYRQTIGRCVRNLSHINLPPEKRRIRIYIYISTLQDLTATQMFERLYDDDVSSEMYMLRRCLDKHESMESKFLQVENIYSPPPKIMVKKHIVSNSRFAIKHCNEVWNIKECFNFNTYKVSHSDFVRENAQVFRNVWVKDTLPKCFNLFIPPDNGPWAVKFKADDKIRILYGSGKLRGQDINTLSVSRRDRISAQLSMIGIYVPSNPRNQDIFKVMQNNNRYIEDQIIITCNCEF